MAKVFMSRVMDEILLLVELSMTQLSQHPVGTDTEFIQISHTKPTGTSVLHRTIKLKGLLQPLNCKIVNGRADAKKEYVAGVHLLKLGFYISK
jgi:hypothetical protein